MPRFLSRHRGYAAFAVATLAVTVGVNVVVFTVVDAVWLKPLPFANADRLVTITGRAPFISLEAPVLRGFDGVAGQAITSETLSGLQPHVVFDRVGREVETLGVTPEYFGLLGLAIRGRDFRPDDNRVGAEPVAIISDRLWTRQFERRSEIVGAVAAARPFPIRIIGVAPRNFEGARRGEQADLWIPSNLVPRVAADAEGLVPLMVFARLRPGQTLTEVARAFSPTPFEPDLAVVRLKDVFAAGPSRTFIIQEGAALSVVAGLAALVLLGGCATLMALVLVHYERRRRELAVRVAVGASRWRLTAELAHELGMIAAAGSIGALLVAVGGLRTIPSLTLPGGVDLGRLDLSIDWRVMSACVMATALTLAAAASLPVRRFTHAGMAGDLLAAGSGSTTPASSQRVRQTLLALHVCATIVVLVSAGLLLRAVINGFGSGPGFDVDRTVFVTVQILSPLREREPPDAWRAAVAERTDRLGAALRSLPGIENLAAGIPPIGREQASYASLPTIVETQREHRQVLLGRMFGSPELLRTLGISILAGRGLSGQDATATNPTPAVVTASLAHMLWPAQAPLGQVLSVGAGHDRDTCLVVGIARDFIFGSFTRPAAGVVVTARQRGFGIEPQFAVRAGYAATLAEPIRKVVTKAVPDAPWVKVATGRDIVARDLGRQRLGAWFFSGFGLTALILGVGGVFGLVAYLAESRQQEFGVRLALGATPRDLVRRSLAAALVPVSFGLAAGLLVAASVARLFTSLLTGLSALDPATYATVATAVLACATLAGLGAAWRLRRVAPGDALRTN